MRLIALLALAILTAAHAWAVEVGEDGLHKQPWMSFTFKDMAERIRGTTP